MSRSIRSTQAWFAVVIVTCGMLGSRLATAAPAGIGAPAPAFTLPDANGASRSLSEFAGKFVVLEWFNNSCPFVGKHYNSGNMQQLQADATGKGVIWLTIVSSAPGKQGHLSPEEARAVVQERRSHHTALLLDSDGSVGRRYGAKTTPHLFIVNPQGQLIYKGAIDDRPSTDVTDIPNAKNYVQQALNEAMAGQPVSIPETPSYGCSVKYE